MDAAHIHLMLNHFPIAGLIFAILLMALGAWRDSEELRRAGMVTVVFTVLITIPVFLTGEPAEEIVKHLPGISEQVIEVHEDAAEKAAWAIGVAVFAAVAGLVITIRRKFTPKWAMLVILGLSIVATAFMAWTNNLGGQVSHPEIRKGTAVNSTPNDGTHGEKIEADSIGATSCLDPVLPKPKHPNV